MLEHKKIVKKDSDKSYSFNLWCDYTFVKVMLNAHPRYHPKQHDTLLHEDVSLPVLSYLEVLKPLGFHDVMSWSGQSG